MTTTIFMTTRPSEKTRVCFHQRWIWGGLPYSPVLSPSILMCWKYLSAPFKNKYRTPTPNVVSRKMFKKYLSFCYVR